MNQSQDVRPVSGFGPHNNPPDCVAVVAPGDVSPTLQVKQRLAALRLRPDLPDSLLHTSTVRQAGDNPGAGKV